MTKLALRLLPTLATLGLLVLLLTLGFWQLDRAQQKQALQNAFSTQSELPPVPVSELDLTDPALRYRRVTARGRYDAEHQILLDNQVYQGQPGFHVYTPLRVAGLAEAILVNRGWVPLGASRQQLPDIAIDEPDVTLHGRLSEPANPGLWLADTADGQVWPRLVQHIDYARLSQQLGYPLAPTVILLDAEKPQGFTRVWRPEFGGFGPARHRAYAVQWFALAAALVVLYLVLSMSRSPQRNGPAEH